MKSITRLILSAAVCMILSGITSVFAQNAPAYDIIFGSGPKGKGYHLLGEDVVQACKKDDFAIQNLDTKGGVDNLTRLAKGDIDVALVQISTLERAAQERPQYRDFRAIAQVNSNLLHGMVKSDGFNYKEADRQVAGKMWGTNTIPGETKTVTFNNITDLKGFTVAAVGSAAEELNDINRTNGLGLNIADRDDKGVALTDETAMQLVQSGKAAAMFTVAGWPHGKLKEADANNKGLTLINYNLNPGKGQKIVTVDYDTIAVRGARLLGIPNLLVTQGYEKGTPGYANVSRFATCLLGEWRNLRNTRGKQPGWKEASDPTDTMGWPRFEIVTSSPTSPVSKEEEPKKKTKK